MKKAQNLIEFIFVMPILIFLTLGIFEVALFWQDVNSIYSLNSEINANVSLIDPRSMTLGTTCTAAIKARDILESKDSIISMNNPTYTTNIAKIGGVDQGSPPFALYQIVSNNTIKGTTHPQVTLWVDCRNPFENGIVTQIEFYHKTMVMKASIPRFDKPEAIEIIPDNIYIASPKQNSIRHY